MTQPFSLLGRTSSWWLHYGVPSTPYGCSFPAWFSDQVHGSQGSFLLVEPPSQAFMRLKIKAVLSFSLSTARRTDSRSWRHAISLVPVLTWGLLPELGAVGEGRTPLACLSPDPCDWTVNSSVCKHAPPFLNENGFFLALIYPNYNNLLLLLPVPLHLPSRSDPVPFCLIIRKQTGF